MFSLLFLLYVITWVGALQENPFLKHLYKYSLKEPFSFLNNHSLPFYSTHGSVTVSHNLLRLTPALPMMKGSVWSKNTLNLEHRDNLLGFNIQIRLNSIGTQSTRSNGFEGKGFGFFLTQEKGLPPAYANLESSSSLDPQGNLLGPFYGMEENYHGAGIVWSAIDEFRQRSMPFVALALSGRGSNTNTGCYYNYRNTERPSNFTLQYWLKERLLILKYDDLKCFEYQNLDLPKQVYLGLTAQTPLRGGDDHNLFSIDVFEMLERPPEEHANMELYRKLKEQKDKISEQEKNKFEQVQKKIHDLKEKHQEEILMHENPSEMTFESKFMEQIKETQLKILENLEFLSGHQSSGSSSVGSSGSLNEVRELKEEITNMKNEMKQMQLLINDQLFLLKDLSLYLTHSGSQTEQQKDLDNLHTLLSNLHLKMDTMNNQQIQTHEQTKRLENEIPLKQNEHTRGWFFYMLGGFVLGQILLFFGYRLVFNREKREKKFI